MSAASLTEFYRQLATMLDSGMAVVRALELLARQRSGMSRCAGRMRAAIDAGATLADAAATQGRQFPPLHLTMIAVGETSGRTSPVLNALATMIEHRQRLRQRVISRLLYPALLLHFAAVVPAIVKWFGPQGSAGAVTAIVATLGPIYVVFFGSWFCWRLVRRLPAAARLLDAVIWQLPIIGGIVRRLGVARFARTFAMLYDAGISVTRSLPLAAAASGNGFLAGRLQRAAPVLADGESLAVAAAHARVFTPIVEGMIATGVETGRLDDMLNKVAEYAEQEAETAIDRLSTIVPLLVYLVIILLVGALVISMWSSHIQTLRSL